MTARCGQPAARGPPALPVASTPPMDLGFSDHVLDGVPVLSLLGDADLATLPRLLERVNRFAVEHPGCRAVIDLDGLGSMDPVVVGVFVRARLALRSDRGRAGPGVHQPRRHLGVRPVGARRHLHAAPVRHGRRDGRSRSGWSRRGPPDDRPRWSRLCDVFVNQRASPLTRPGRAAYQGDRDALATQPSSTHLARLGALRAAVGGPAGPAVHEHRSGVGRRHAGGRDRRPGLGQLALAGRLRTTLGDTDRTSPSGR